MAPVRWFGGKGNLLPWIAQFVPYARTYVEPFGGAASLLFQREPSRVEVYNDLHEDLVNLFRVLQDPEASKELEYRIKYTLYSRSELERSIHIYNNPAPSQSYVLRAWAFYTLCNQTFSGVGPYAKTSGYWSKCITTSDNNKAATVNKWQSRQQLFQAWRERIARVQIECRPALYVLDQYDTPDTIFYVDPPYVHDTRKGKVYDHELENEDHTKLVNTLLTLQGSVTLSAYAHELYQPLEANGWERYDRQTASNAAGRIRGSKLQGRGSGLQHAARTESIYINPRCQKLLQAGKLQLFD
jgi:DNA adenine methylase